MGGLRWNRGGNSSRYPRHQLMAKAALIVAISLCVSSGSLRASGGSFLGSGGSLLLGALQGASATQPATPGFQLIYQDNFTTDVPLGAFSDCNHNPSTPAAYCGGLAAYPSVEANWWSYPAGWPDTATERNLPLGGFYDPATTVWISGGEMHIRMWRGATGANHSATMVPKAAIGMLYGQFTETFEVSQVATGFKSAHLLWPAATCVGCEIDFPEGDWDGSIEAFNHPKGGGNQDSFGNGTPWTGWHTSTIQWTPGDVKFSLDGKLIGQSTNNVMDSAAEWDIQNESSLDGEMAAPNSSAEMDIKSVSVYRYQPVVGMASLPDGSGYWLADAQGGVSTHGDAVSYGSMAGQHLNAPISHIVATPDGKGYWLVAVDGGIFTFGDAGFFGSMGNQHLNAPVVDIAPTADGHGYWLVASDGGIFSFGDAQFQGSMGGTHLNNPVVGIAPDHATGGYWEVATDGGIFSFGAPFFGSTGAMHLNKPVNGMTATPDDQGYSFAASDGGIFSFGDAQFQGSMGGTPLNAPVVGMASDGATGGYWLVASDGGIFSFGAPFYGAD